MMVMSSGVGLGSCEGGSVGWERGEEKRREKRRYSDARVNRLRVSSSPSEMKKVKEAGLSGPGLLDHERMCKHHGRPVDQKGEASSRANAVLSVDEGEEGQLTIAV